MNKLNNWTSEAAEKKRKTKEKFYGYSEGEHAEGWSDTRGMGEIILCGGPKGSIWKKM